MKRVLLLMLIFLLGIGCSNHYVSAGKQVKPKTRNRYYNPKKDKGKKRTKKVKTKVVKMKN